MKWLLIRRHGFATIPLSLKTLVPLLLLMGEPTERAQAQCGLFQRGDANADGSMDISDPVSILGFLFREFPRELPCEDAADANDDGVIDMSDAVAALGFLFLGTLSPSEPFHECGLDPSEDDLDCCSFAPCKKQWSELQEAHVAFLQGDSSWGLPTFATSLAVDGSGNLYVTGKAFGGCPISFPCFIYYLTIKYDAAGEEIWRALIQLPVFPPVADWSVSTASLALDRQGNPHILEEYLTGDGEPFNRDYLTVKYSTEGEEIWRAVYDSPGGGQDRPGAMAIDVEGNVYVTGYSEGDLAMVKYSPQGKELWVTRVSGPEIQIRPQTLALDGAGNATIATASAGDLLTIKYDPEGHELWSARFHEEAVTAHASALAVDDARNVLVAGHQSPTGVGPSSCILIKYSPEGGQIWSTRYEAPDSRGNSLTAIALDGSGDIVVTGRASGRRSSEFSTLKFDAGGELLWSACFATATDLGCSSGGAQALSLDGSGNVYVVGGSGGDLTTIVYSRDGNEIALGRHPGRMYTVSIAVDSAGNIHVAASGEDGDAYLVIKYHRVDDLK